MPGNPSGLTWNLIHEARERIAGKVGVTPVLTSTTLDARAGARLHFKCENFQKCGAFKARGATNAVFALSESQARRGVATHSSGNHAAALARAARLRGIPAYIVMPDNTVQTKRAAVRRYGGEITYCESTLAAREEPERQATAATRANPVPPYARPRARPHPGPGGGRGPLERHRGRGQDRQARHPRDRRRARRRRRCRALVP